MTRRTLSRPLRGSATRLGAVARWVAVVALAGAIGAGLPSAAVGAAPEPSTEVTDEATDAAAETITWAVDPAGADGPDGRPWVEVELDPGETVSDQIAVRNLSSVPATFAIRAADGYFTENGRFSMRLADEESTGAGGWITVQDSVDVEAGSTALVPFTVTVPDDATPGDHAAGLAASILFAGDGTVSVNGRVGIRVITRVTGEVVPSVGVTAFTTAYDTAWNPFTAGAVDVTATLANDGNVALDVVPTVVVAGREVVLALPSGATELTMLPGDERTVTGRLAEVWPLGPITSELAATGSGDGLVPATAAAETSTWAVPLPQILALTGVVLLLLTLRGDSRRRRRNLARMLADARAQGRQEAPAAQVRVPEGTVARRARRPVIVGVALAALLLGAGAGAAAPAGQEGVRVEVVIPEQGTTTSPGPTSPTGGTDPTEPTSGSSGGPGATDDPSVSASPSPGAGGLGANGATGTAALVLTAAALLLTGGVLVARRGGRPSS